MIESDQLEATQQALNIALIALEAIAMVDPTELNGFTDEWEQARCFSECQAIAEKALKEIK